MTEADLDVLVGRISKGEDRAFESVMQAFRWHVFQYLRRFGLTYETAEDVVQETFFAAYKAIRRGQYQHHNTAAFAGWLRIIARRIMIHAHIATSNDMIEPLDFEVSGDVGARDPAEAGPGPDMQAEQSELFAFLQRQLDEALIANQSTDEGRDVGLIKKMAFLRFYVDQLSQSEILELAFEDAVRLNILGQLTSSTINNWISRGDILKTLVHHLVQRHPEIVDKLSKHWTASRDLDRDERDLLHLEWGLGKSCSEIAASQNLPLAKVNELLALAKHKLAKSLFKRMKTELHELRFEKDA